MQQQDGYDNAGDARSEGSEGKSYRVHGMMQGRRRGGGRFSRRIGSRGNVGNLVAVEYVVNILLGETPVWRFGLM